MLATTSRTEAPSAPLASVALFDLSDLTNQIMIGAKKFVRTDHQVWLHGRRLWTQPELSGIRPLGRSIFVPNTDATGHVLLLERVTHAYVKVDDAAELLSLTHLREAGLVVSQLGYGPVLPCRSGWSGSVYLADKENTCIRFHCNPA